MRQAIRKSIVGVGSIAAAVSATWVQVGRVRAAVPRVWTERVEWQPLAATVTAQGVLSAARTITLAASADGRVRAVAVRQGQRVVAGQALVALDAGPAEMAARRAEAEALASRAAAARAHAEAQAAWRKAEQSRQRAVRIERLFLAGLATQEALEAARHAVVVEGLEAGIVGEQAVTAGMQAAAAARLADMATHAVDAVVERAPHDGVVARVLVRPGEWIHAGAPHIVPTGLVVLDSAEPSDIDLRLPQGDAVRMRPGLPAGVVIPTLSSRSWPARIVAVGEGADGTTSVRVRLDRSPPNARPGLSATVHWTVASRVHALGVPNHALLALPRADGAARAGHGVWTIRDGLMALAPLTLGLRGDAYTEVLAGLTPGDLVVTGPSALVRAMGTGDRVVAMPAPMRAGP